MVCPSCGVDLPGGAVYCHKCGERTDLRAAAHTVPRDEGVPQRGGVLQGGPAPAERSPKERLVGHRTDDNESENVLWSGGYSPKAMIGSWLGMGFLTVMLVIVGVMFSIVFVVIVIGLLVLWIGLGLLLAYRILNVSYQLSNQRFVHRTGILRRITDRIEVIDMDDVAYEQSIVERLINVGTIEVASSDRSHPKLILYGIDDVERVATLIDDARHKERMRRGLHIEAI